MIKKRLDSKGNELYCGEYERKDGNYMYRYRTREGEVKYIYNDNLSELRIEESKAMLIEQINISKKIKGMILNDQYELWISSKFTLRDSTKEQYKFLYDAYIRNSLGKMRIEDITTYEIKCRYEKLHYVERKSVETISQIQNVLFQVMQSALECDIISRNPADRACKHLVRSHSKYTSTRKSLNKIQTRKLLLFLKENDQYKRWYPLIYTFIYTGLRISEMAAVQWDDIDYDNKTISIQKTIKYINGKDQRYKIYPPKTSSGKRILPLTVKMIEALELEKYHQNSEHIKCNVTVEGFKNFVFLTRKGTPISQETVNRALKRIVFEYNKQECFTETAKKIILPDITSHVLRHTFARILCESNINIKVAQKLLGHSDIETTMNIYTDVSEEFQMKEFFDKVKEL
ncbi:site-specific recombinase XerD [Lachnospiraceae bacterium JC7]|nr:site-specific recombinase XerD [Lachnospiraceae bacterium JC7]